MPIHYQAGANIVTTHWKALRIFQKKVARLRLREACHKNPRAMPICDRHMASDACQNIASGGCPLRAHLAQWHTMTNKSVANPNQQRISMQH